MDLNEALNYVLGFLPEVEKIVLDIYNKEFEVRDKGREDFVTEADQASETFIVEKLREKYDFPILAEETVNDEERLNSEFVWLIDPIDGTKEFVRKSGAFCMMVCLLQNNKPVLGIIRRPIVEDTVYAIKGEGTFRLKDGKKERMRVSPNDKISLDRIRVNRKSVELNEPDEFEDKIGEAFGTKENGVWCIGYEVCEMVLGNIDVWMYTGGSGSEWDTGPCEIILEEAGGKLTDINGDDAEYNQEDVKQKKHIVCTNGVLHQKVISKIKEAIK